MIRKLLSPVYQQYIRWNEFRIFKKALSQKPNPLRLVIGSSGIFDAGWVPSEAHFLNLLNAEEWLKYFQVNSIQNIVAEHVWEHLSQADGLTAAKTCFRFLAPGGRLRVAVPDGFHSDPAYIDYVKPGGHGAGAFDHKVLYNYQSFTKLFEEAGFSVELLEHFDEKHEFHAKAWSDEGGHVRRSIRYDERNSDGKPHYTSLLLDAIKK